MRFNLWKNYRYSKQVENEETPPDWDWQRIDPMVESRLIIAQEMDKKLSPDKVFNFLVLFSKCGGCIILWTDIMT